MKIVFLCFCLVIGVAGFIIVLNSREEESKLYPGSNVRYWASFPLALVFLTGTVWLFPEQLLHITAVGNYIMLLLWVGIIIVYCAWIESRFQGGMVKRMMHAVVVDKQGKPVDFITALQRNLCKWLLFPLAPLSLHLITRDPRRRALHDKFAKTFVMWAPDMIKANEGQSGYEVEQVYEKRQK